MKTKRLVLAVLLVPLLLLSAGLVLIALLDDTVLVSWVVKRIEVATDTRISYRQPPALSRGLAPTLELRGLQVVGTEGSFQASTDSFIIQVSLPAMLIGRLDIPRLSLGDTDVRLSGNGTGGAGFDINPSMLRFTPVLHSVELAGLSVSAQDGAWQLPSGKVRELNLRLLPDDATPELSADVAVRGDVLHVDATLPRFYQPGRRQALPFTVDVKGRLADAHLKGKVEFGRAGSRLDAQLRLDAADLSGWPTGIDGLQLPGSLTLAAVLSGPFDGLAASNIEAEWRGPDQSSMRLDGGIDNLLELAGIRLNLDADIQKPDWLAGHLPESLGPLAGVKVKAAVGGSRERLAVDGLQFDAETARQLKIDLDGRCELAWVDKVGFNVEQISAKLAFEAPTTRAARALLFDTVPEFGAITGRTDVASTTGPPALDNIDITTRDGRGTSVSLSGRIAQFPLDPAVPNRGYDLDVSIAADKARTVLAAVNSDLPVAGPLNLGFRIQGDTPALELNRIHLSAGSAKAVSIKAAGSLHFGDWALRDPLQAIDLQVNGYSHSSAALAKLAGLGTVPELGPLTAHGHVRTVSGQHRVEDILLGTVKGAAVQLALTGSVSKLDVLPKPRLSGLQLELSGRGNDTAALNRLFAADHKWIPSLGAFDLHSRVTGSDRSISIEDTSMAVGTKAVLRLVARGRGGRLDAGDGWQLRDTDLRLEASSDSSQALAESLGYRLPPLGSLSGSGIVRQKGASLALADLKLRVGTPDRAPAMNAVGRVGDLYGMKDINIDAKLNIDGHNLAAFADLEKIEDLTPLTGSMRIADSNGAVGVQSLRLNSDGPSLSINVTGSFPDFRKPGTLKLNARVHARDLALIGALFDRSWPAYAPFNAFAEIGQEGTLTTLDMTAKAGPRQVDADLHGDFNASPPRITGKLTMHDLGLPDFFQKVATQRKERKKAAKQAEEPLFSHQPIDFERLKRVDLDVQVDVASFDPDSSPARSADMTVTLKDGLLTVGPVLVSYPKGHMKVTLSLDARDKPKITFRAYGQNIDPWRDLPRWTETNAAGFGADLDVDIDLDASGDSVYGLVSSLDGNVFVTSRHGKISRSLVDLLFVDIAGWAASKISDSRYLDITCGVADFTLKDGVASTRAFFLDTKNITITGDGKIDLGNETVDYVFIPKKKSRIILKAEPVKVKGPLLEPSVTAIPVKSAALTFGTLLFAPYVFVGLTASDYIMGRFKNGDAAAPCLNYEKGRGLGDKPGDLPAGQ